MWLDSCFFFSSRRRHTRCSRDWSSDVCSSDLGLVLLVVLFTAYLRKKTGEISELRGLLRGLEERDAEPPSDKQLDQLFDIVSRSQQGYRDLFDSFVDILLVVGVEWRFRAVDSR